MDAAPPDPFLQVVAEQGADHLVDRRRDDRVEPVTAEVGTHARDLDGGRHPADVVGGLEQDRVPTSACRLEGRHQAGRAGTEHGDVVALHHHSGERP